MTNTGEDLRYPIGRLDVPAPVTSAMREAAIDVIAELPSRLRAAIAGLTDAQLDTPYRPGGWTVRQLVHHIADSHMNGFIRVKLTLTEQDPTIKPYDENAWATLPDVTLPVEVSLGIIDGLHARWAAVYRGISGSDFGRTFVHPEIGGGLTLEWHLLNYAWHSRHHVAHITGLRRREGW